MEGRATLGRRPTVLIIMGKLGWGLKVPAFTQLCISNVNGFYIEKLRKNWPSEIGDCRLDVKAFCGYFAGLFYLNINGHNILFLCKFTYIAYT